MPQNVSNTQTGLGNIGGWEPVHQYAPRPQQIHWNSTNNGHTVAGNTLHDSNNTAAPRDAYAMNSLTGGVNNTMLSPSLIYPYPGSFENPQSIHTPVHYSNIYGTLPPRTNRGSPVSTITEHDYPPQQAMGFRQHQAPALGGNGSGNTSPSTYYGSYESGQMPGKDNQLQTWSSDSPPTSLVQPRSTSPLKAVSHHTRKCSQRHLNPRYTDPLLLQKYPEERHYALGLAMQFREDHGAGSPIPNDLIDELLEGPDDGKYYCFCCPRARKLRAITPARDHVRKSLGNYPFKCSNPWCQHSSLRLADLTKHMKTCGNTNTYQ